MKIAFMLTLSLVFISLHSTVWAQYDCVEGDCIDGIGKKQVKSSSAFLKGKFKNGVLLKGTVVFQNGNVFTGKFEDHKLVVGTKNFFDGTKLQGKFIENVMIDGVITYRDGTSRRVKLDPYNRHSK